MVAHTDFAMDLIATAAILLSYSRKSMCWDIATWFRHLRANHQEKKNYKLALSSYEYIIQGDSGKIGMEDKCKILFLLVYFSFINLSILEMSIFFLGNCN